MPTSMISVADGPKITVNDFIKAPTVVPRRVLDMTKNMFIADAVLRQGPPVPSGLVKHYESTPLFADDAAAIVEEFGEIPTAGGSLGNPVLLHTVTRALAVVISQQMVNRNDVDAVNTRITQVRNTMVRTWDNAFVSALYGNASVGSVAATAVWSNAATSKIRRDLAQAMKVITDATDANGDYLGYEPDTLLIGTSTKADFLASDDVSKVFIGNAASDNPQLSGRLPNNFYGLNVMTTRSLPAGDALVLESKTVGYISDETPLSATPLYEQRERRQWRSDTLRESVVGIDNPKAACLITGV